MSFALTYLHGSPPAAAGPGQAPGLSVPAPSIPAMQASAPARSAAAAATAAASAAAARTWDGLRARCQAVLPVPGSPASGLCQVCTGPARPGYARCFQCELHAQSAPGLLADAVAPVAYAVKGSRLARDLWRYKAGGPGSEAAGSRLRLLLLVFLHDHGSQVWRQAGMARPSHVCAVPSGRGRPGPHPLQSLVSPYLTLPWASMRAEPGGDPWARALDPGRFRAGQPVTGAAVLLLDDTWASGASAQSAAVALKQAGARTVAVVVIGRHVPAAGGVPCTRPALCSTGVPPGSGSIGWSRDPGLPLTDRPCPPGAADQP